MNGKVEQSRGLISTRANQLWQKGVEYDPRLKFDYVKVTLEHLIEEYFLVPNMWEPSFVKDVSLVAIGWLLDTVDAMELVCEVGGGRV